MSRAIMMQLRQNSTYQWEGRMKNVLAAVVLAVASLIGMNLTAGTDATVISDPAFTVSIPELATMHVPKKYSRSAAIARAQAKYPGYKLSHVRELQNVWVVVLKK